MKKVLVSLLVGVTLCGGLFGCGNKEVVEEVKPEVEVSQDYKEDVVVEPSKEEVIEGILDTIRQMREDVNSQMNASSEYFFTYSEITYDSYTNTIEIKDYMNSKDGDNNKYIVALNMAEDTSSLFTSMKGTCDMEYNTALSLLDLNEIDDVDIVVTQFMGEYKVLETKNGEVVYTLQQ